MYGYQDSMLGHDLPEELSRLRLLETMLDPMTLTVLDQIGIGSTWRCLEIGAGAGSIARDLARRAIGGDVVATDLDVRFLPRDVPNLTVLQHDITSDELPGEAFDLIHARMVLEHIPARDDVLRRLVTWLAPGGWICVEGIDDSTSWSSPYAPVRAAMDGLVATMEAELGTDPGYARRATGIMRAAGLQPVHLAATPIVTGDGGTGDAFLGAMIRRLSPVMTATGRATPEDIEAMMRWLAAPDGVDVAALFVSACGRRSA